jgi:hypothetical protein
MSHRARREHSYRPSRLVFGVVVVLSLMAASTVYYNSLAAAPEVSRGSVDRSLLALASSRALARQHTHKKRDVSRADPASPRTIVIGDVHGDVDCFLSSLALASVIDGNSNWAAGQDTVVQV